MSATESGFKVLKKISVRQLRMGMHIHEFCGAWMDHPFWRSRFTLRTPEEFQRIASSSITEVWIDTAKGNDVPEAGGPAEVAQERTECKPETEPLVPTPSKPVKDDMSELALRGAAALYRRSVPKIAAMFEDARLGRVVDSASCEALVDEISAAVLHNPGALISVARLKRRDEYTYMHSVAVCTLMIALGRQLGLQGDALKQVGLGGMLHDLGKAVIPSELLNKPGPLTDAEFTLVRTHPERGHGLLLEGEGVGPVVFDVCLHHHERVDGSGYPHGLSGDQISLYAKMAAVCDVYDAVTSARAYKNAWNPPEALRSMAQWKGHFDTQVFHAFVKTVGIYPVGSLVRLQSGRLAVVTAQNPRSLLTPQVKAFFNIKSDLRIEPQLIDLAGDRSNDKVVGCEAFDDWPFKDLDQLWGAPRAMSERAVPAVGEVG